MEIVLAGFEIILILFECRFYKTNILIIFKQFATVAHKSCCGVVNFVPMKWGKGK